ncbi:PspC domain-containing protein [Latilactobacillus sakei]
MAQKRLYKSRDNRMISGVMGGIAEYFNVDATLVRVLYCLFSIFSASFPGDCRLYYLGPRYSGTAKSNASRFSR